MTLTFMGWLVDDPVTLFVITLYNSKVIYFMPARGQIEG